MGEHLLGNGQGRIFQAERSIREEEAQNLRTNHVRLQVAWSFWSMGSSVWRERQRGDHCHGMLDSAFLAPRRMSELSDWFREETRGKHMQISLGETLQSLQELFTVESWLSHRELITTLKKAHVCTHVQKWEANKLHGEEGDQKRGPKRDMFKAWSCLS